MTFYEGITVGWLVILTGLVFWRGMWIENAVNKVGGRAEETRLSIISISGDIDRIEAHFRAFTPAPPVTYATMDERQINCQHEMDISDIINDTKARIGRARLCKKCGYYRDHYLHEHIPDGYLDRFPDAKPRMLVDHETNPSWPLVKAPDTI